MKILSDTFTSPNPVDPNAAAVAARQPNPPVANPDPPAANPPAANSPPAWVAEPEVGRGTENPVPRLSRPPLLMNGRSEA